MTRDSASDAGLPPNPSLPAAGRRPSPRIAGFVGLILLGILGLSWSMSSAPGSSPDDDFHLASIWCAWGREETGCEILSRPPPPESFAVSISTLSRHASGCWIPLREESGRCIYQREDGTYGEVPPRAWPGRANNGGYPNGFYAYERLFVSQDVPRSLVLVRLSSFAASMLLLLVPAMLLSESNRTRLWFHWLVVSVPLGTFIFASTNPSGVAISSAAAVFASSFAAMTLESRRRSWVAVAVGVFAAGMGIATRPDAPYYITIAFVVGLLAGVTDFSVSTARRLLTVAPLGGLLLAALYFGREGSGKIDGAAYGDGTVPLFPNVINVASLYLGDFATRLGWLDTSMPSVVWGGVALALGGLLVLGITELTPGRTMAIGIAAVASLAVPLFLLQRTGNPIGEFVQPRYVLPLVMALAGALAVRSQASHSGPQRTQALMIAFLALVAHSVALHTNLRRYLTGTDVTDWNLNRGIEWWWSIPFSPMVVWWAGSISFAILAVWLALRITVHELDRSVGATRWATSGGPGGSACDDQPS